MERFTTTNSKLESYQELRVSIHLHWNVDEGFPNLVRQ